MQRIVCSYDQGLEAHQIASSSSTPSLRLEVFFHILPHAPRCLPTQTPTSVSDTQRVPTQQLHDGVCRVCVPVAVDRLLHRRQVLRGAHVRPSVACAGKSQCHLQVWLHFVLHHPLQLSHSQARHIASPIARPVVRLGCNHWVFPVSSVRLPASVQSPARFPSVFNNSWYQEDPVDFKPWSSSSPPFPCWCSSSAQRRRQRRWLEI